MQHHDPRLVAGSGHGRPDQGQRPALLRPAPDPPRRGGHGPKEPGLAETLRHDLHAMDASLRRLAVPIREVRAIATAQRRRNLVLTIIAVVLFVLICANIALVTVATQIAGDVAQPAGCRLAGGHWGANPTGREYCVFWAPAR